RSTREDAPAVRRTARRPCSPIADLARIEHPVAAPGVLTGPGSIAEIACVRVAVVVARNAARSQLTGCAAVRARGVAVVALLAGVEDAVRAERRRVGTLPGAVADILRAGAAVVPAGRVAR